MKLKFQDTLFDLILEKFHLKCNRALLLTYLNAIP